MNTTEKVLTCLTGLTFVAALASAIAWVWDKKHEDQWGWTTFILLLVLWLLWVALEPDDRDES